MFTKLVLVAAMLVAPSALAFTEDNYSFLFNAWKSSYGREYLTEEESAMRYAIFKVNLDTVNAHNAKGESWFMRMNEFGDLTHHEFSEGRVGGYVPRSLRRQAPAGSLVHTSDVSVELPSSVDWTAEGKVTAVKNQGQCGSCWAFSTTGSTESINAINGKGLTSLSEQQLVDCSGSFGNQGCNGGLMDSAFEYIVSNGGLCTEASYPYKAADGSCTQCTPVTKISGHTDVSHNDDSAFASAVAQQPVSIAIQANQASFQFYGGGVLTGSCGTALDHGVLAVGYGTDSGTEYWKVKNSWGASWGEKGYVRLARGSQYNGGAGQCGIYMQPSYPTQ